MITTTKQLVGIVRQVLHQIRNGWKILHTQKLGLYAYVTLVRRDRQIAVSIVETKLWTDKTIQHVQFEIDKLFICFATINQDSVYQTFKNVRHSLLYTMALFQRPTAYKMAMIVYESIKICCLNEKVTFTRPKKFTQNNVWAFTIDREFTSRRLFLEIVFWICPQCGPHFTIQLHKPCTKKLIFRKKYVLKLIDICIDEISCMVYYTKRK